MPGLTPAFDRPSRKDLLKTIAQIQANQTTYLRALAALLIEHDGEIRIPASTYALLDPAMVVRQTVDADRHQIVFTLVVPASQEQAHA